MNLTSVWNQIENKTKCKGCSLEHPKYRPLVIKIPRPEITRVTVITEGPNRRTDEKFLASIANHPTFTFLYAIFGGKFRPIGASANAYWTHVRKCFINSDTKKGQAAIGTCSRAYLEDEIVAFKPKLILSVGKEALHFLSRYDYRLHGNLTRVFLKQTKEIFRDVEIKEVRANIAVMPHPSGLNRFWNEPPNKTLKILRKIKRRIIETTEGRIKKGQYNFYVLSKIPEDSIYCKKCKAKWPKTRIKPSRPYSIYIRDPRGHVLYIFCYDCDTSYKNSHVKVHEKGGRKTIFCPKGHKIRLKLDMKELRKLLNP